MTFQQYPFKGGVPTGNTANRPSSAVTGDVYYNGQLGLLEIYDGTNWIPCSAPAGIPTVVATDVGTSRAYGSGAISFSFTAGTNGGSPYGYTGTATVSATTYTTGSTTSATPTLTVGNNGTYSVSGTAYNGFGTSPASVPENVNVTTVPQAPTIGSASTSAGTTNVSVSWTLNNNGGKNLTSITITPYLNGTTAQTSQTASTTSSTSHTFTGLAVNSAYTFKVKATNANGDSLESSASNSVTTPNTRSFDIMVVAGGGGTVSGGGGAGGFRVLTSQMLTVGTQYTATVGGGGTGGTNGGNLGTKGTNSSFSGTGLTTITSTGGGRGGSINEDNAGTGGSGGGAGRASVYQSGNKAGNEGGYSPAEGNSGGKNLDQNPYNGGGGGGGGGAGENATTTTTTDAGAKGGVGNSSYSSWGSATSSGENVSGTYYYAGGGGSGGDGGNSPRGLGGSGGGGAGSYNGNGTAGTPNTGGGGGGNGSTSSGGAGGSGIIILRTSGSYTASATTGSPTRYETGGFTYYKFTGDGTITV